jgi:DNA-binding MarR family transcriptional regulator
VLRTGSDPADRRRTLVFPTEALSGQFGKILAQSAWPFLDPLLGDLDPADRASFERVLGRLHEHFKETEEESRRNAGGTSS